MAAEISTIFTIDSQQKCWGGGVSYTRILELKHSGENNGTLLATFEYYTSGLAEKPPGYPIMRSTDGGETWTQIATIREKNAQVQSEYQPILYELPQAVGEMPAGTMLCAAVSIDAAHAKVSSIRMYRSYDCGETWEQYSFVVTAGGLEDGAWEPFLLVIPDGRLVCYYSDSTDPQHSQKLSGALSADGVVFDEFFDIVAMDEYMLRPGMAVVAQMNDGRFIMVYEVVREDNANSGNPVYYRYSCDGIDFGDPRDLGTKLVTVNGEVPGSSPYVAYAPNVGDNGMLLVTASFQSPSCKNRSQLYINRNYGEGAWETMPLPLACAVGGYSKAMDVASDGKTVYFVNDIADENNENGYCKVVFTRQTME